MNILGDFMTRVNDLYPDIDNEELSSLLTSIRNQEEELEMKDKEIVKLHAIIDKLTRESGKKQQKDHSHCQSRRETGKKRHKQSYDKEKNSHTTRKK